MRIGLGYDSHRFSGGRPLILGGVTIPGAPGLEGFSDADAVAHAVTDALLGAGGLGSIGEHFPPGEETWRDADSMELLARSASLLRDAGYRVVNVDVTVVTERPRILPHAGEMRERLGEVVGVGAGAVSVKGKSNEGLGWIGKGEGLAVLAVALIEGGGEVPES